MKFNVSGMSCAACQARVEKCVSALDGVDSCAVNLLRGNLTVTGSVSSEAVIDAVVKAGYGATLCDGKKTNNVNDSIQNTEKSNIIARFIVSLVILIPLMYVSMGHTMLGAPLPEAMVNSPISVALCELLLSAAIIVINSRFFVSGARAMWHRAPNMDSLVSLGSGASFVWSVAVVFMMCFDPESAGGHLHGLYFESAAMILVLITLGKMLEERAKGKTTDAIRALTSLAPTMATLVVDGEEITVAAGEVKVGDIFAVRPGEAVPVDGVIIKGESALVEAALTGESVPKDKGVGDGVFAATVNTSGYILCRAERVGEDTALSSVIRLVDDAASTKAPIAKIADRVSGIFVPVVIAIAAVAFAVWLIATGDAGYALGRGISVLVISCPCALGLATPVAITVGSGVGARLGILYKSAEALEGAARVKACALDKTGTLTEGTPKVTDVRAIGCTEEELCRYAAAAEAKSEHPLARAIVEYVGAIDDIPDADSFEAISGSGVRATVLGHSLLCGSYKFIFGESGAPSDVRDARERLSKEGKTPVFFTRDGVLIGYFGISDSVREDARRAVGELHSLGMRVVMLTGDNKNTALAVAAEVGIPEEDVFSELMPADKVEKVKALSADGGVMMIGDGINDAPALVAADVGVAIGKGTDIAIDSADVVLMRAELSGVPRTVRLGRKVLRNIHQNLFWAFIYNTLGIPIAAGVFIPLFGLTLSPMFGALAMSLSSVTVVSNALRLNAFPASEQRYAVNTATRVEKNRQPLAENATSCDGFAEGGSVDTNADTNEEIINRKEDNNMQITLKVEGMMCPHCEGRVKRALEALDSVESAEVSHESGTAKVTLRSETSRDALVKVIVDAGYEVVG